MAETPTLIPWGKLNNGKLGLNIDDVTKEQLNAVLEVWTDLATADAGAPNFPGRLVMDAATGQVYTYDPSILDWRELGALPATVGAVGGNPPTTPTPLDGELFWDLDTKVAFVWDGSQWEPIGGRYAGLFRSAYHPGVSGAQSAFSLGLTAPEIDSIAGAPQNVEAFIDGVRQSYAAGQYTVVGGNVNFTIPPPAGTNVYLRALVNDAIAPTAEITTKYHEADGISKSFETGVVGVDRKGTFVYVNGVMQVGPESGSALFGRDPDYDIISQDTTITQVQVTSVIDNRITVETLEPHNATVGATIVIEGVSTEPGYNGTYSVETTPGVTTLTYIHPDVTALAAGPITDPGMYYTPAFVTDKIQLPFYLADPALPVDTQVLIKAVRNLLTVETTGEANNGTNIGAGVPVFKDKVGVDLRYRTLLAGANVAIIDTGNEVLISATSANTFEDRNGINTGYHLLGSTESWIGVLSTGVPVTIDLSSVTDVVDAGRRVVIKDESGGAAANNITIIHGGRTFDGQPNYIITQNYGSVTLVFSGSNWYIGGGTAAGGGGGGGVTSFAARVGAVVPQAGDYNAVKITYSNVGSGLTATDVQNAIDELAAGPPQTTPSGVAMPFAGDVAVLPLGWLLCDGKTIGDNVSGADITGPELEDLFNVVRTFVGDGNSGLEDFALHDTVKLPDLRGRIPVGPDNMGGVQVGRLTVTSQVTDRNTPGASGGEDRHSLSPAEVGAGVDVAKQAGAGALDYLTDTGGASAHNNMQPFQLMNWIIKV